MESKRKLQLIVNEKTAKIESELTGTSRPQTSIAKSDYFCNHKLIPALCQLKVEHQIASSPVKTYSYTDPRLKRDQICENDVTIGAPDRIFNFSVSNVGFFILYYTYTDGPSRWCIDRTVSDERDCKPYKFSAGCRDQVLENLTVGDIIFRLLILAGRSDLVNLALAPSAVTTSWPTTKWGQFYRIYLEPALHRIRTVYQKPVTGEKQGKYTDNLSDAITNDLSQLERTKKIGLPSRIFLFTINGTKMFIFYYTFSSSSNPSQYYCNVLNKENATFKKGIEKRENEVTDYKLLAEFIMLDIHGH